MDPCFASRPTPHRNALPGGLRGGPDADPRRRGSIPIIRSFKDVPRRRYPRARLGLPGLHRPRARSYFPGRELRSGDQAQPGVARRNSAKRSVDVVATVTRPKTSTYLRSTPICPQGRNRLVRVFAWNDLRDHLDEAEALAPGIRGPLAHHRAPSGGGRKRGFGRGHPLRDAGAFLAVCGLDGPGAAGRFSTRQGSRSPKHRLPEWKVVRLLPPISERCRPDAGAGEEHRRRDGTSAWTPLSLQVRMERIADHLRPRRDGGTRVRSLVFLPWALGPVWETLCAWFWHGRARF